MVASSLLDRQELDPDRDFGLYMDDRWRPSWPADVIAWADFGTPADPAEAARQIVSAFDRAARGERIEIGCAAGLGRTGTVLACMAVLAGVRPDEAVAWVRTNYHPGAVETPEQEAWIHRFAAQVKPRSTG